MATKKDLDIKDFQLSAVLDSARTAHTLRVSEQKDNWWLPKRNDVYQKHLASAEAIALKQILLGNVLVLPRNQFFDSPAWLKVAEYLLVTKVPIFAFSILDKDLPLSPRGFVLDVAKGFDVREGQLPSSVFALSAWPGLEINRRRMIAENIRKKGDFSEMFLNVPVDSQYEVTFESQQAALQQIYLYLEKNLFNPDAPSLIVRSGGPKTSLWDKVSADLSNIQFLEILNKKFQPGFSQDYVGRIKEIEGQIKYGFKERPDKEREEETRKAINARSTWLTNIWKDSPNLREAIRQHIDNRYVHTLSESVTLDGALAHADRVDTNLDHEVRDEVSDQLDSIFDPDGLEEDFDILFAETKDPQGFLKRISESLKDPEFTKPLLEIRHVQRLVKDKIFVKEKKEEHLNYLEKFIPELEIKKSPQGQIVSFLYDNGVTLVGVIGSRFIPEIPLETSTIGGKAVDFIKNKIDAYLADNVGVHIRGLVMDVVFSKEKTALTGKIRNWLRHKDKI